MLAKKGTQVKLVRFGDPNMTIKKDQPGRRKSFRARHNCDTLKINLVPDTGRVRHGDESGASCKDVRKTRRRC